MYTTNQSNNILVFIIFLLGLDLLTTGSITWSVWPAGIFTLFYFLSLGRSEDRASKDFTFMRERFAKGEISEEEFIEQKKAYERHGSSHREGGFNYFTGAILMMLGFILVIRNLFDFDIPWLPIILIAVGLFAIVRNLRYQ